jgi:hypothetical protein
MKLLNLSIVAILIASLSFTSCDKEVICTDGDGAIITKTLSIADFTGIDLEEAGDVIISQGATQEVVVTGHSNIVNKLKTDVSGDIWKIDLGRGCFDNYELTIMVTVPDLETVRLSGSGNITVNDFTGQNNDLELDISGSGEMFLNTFNSPNNLNVNISGSGAITFYEEITGVNKLDLRISGSGEFYGFLVNADECKIKVSGSGDCEVSVNDELDVNISGSGNVYYKGNPTLTQHISGSGTLINAN